MKNCCNSEWSSSRYRHTGFARTPDVCNLEKAPPVSMIHLSKSASSPIKPTPFTLGFWGKEWWEVTEGPHSFVGNRIHDTILGHTGYSIPFLLYFKTWMSLYHLNDELLMWHMPVGEPHLCCLKCTSWSIGKVHTLCIRCEIGCNKTLLPFIDVQ